MNRKVFIVAELSANHNNDFDLAVKTIKAMAESGVDAVKVQTYKPESLTLDLDTGCFAPKTGGIWNGYTPWKLYTEAAMPYEWQPKLKRIAEELGLIFFSSPFDKEAVDFLEDMDVPMYKVASFEITDIPLIKHIALKGKPVIISTGVADQEDIRLAVDTCRGVGNDKITLLKCTSQYPATIEQANLATIPDLQRCFNTEVGVSDHTLGSIVPIVGVVLGATMIEKHFILDRNLGGPDSSFSMEPEEFKDMVRAVRQAEAALGDVSYQLTAKDKNRRRSLFVVKDIKAKELFTENNIRSIRPGYGLHPRFINEVLLRRAKIDLAKGTPLRFDYIE